MRHVPTEARRRRIRGLVLMVALAGLAAAAILGGCGSGGGGTATAPSGSSATSAQATSDAALATTWTRQNSKSAVTNAQLTSVSFVDASHGRAVGFGLDASKQIAPLILPTGDGGATWKMQDAGGAGSAKLKLGEYGRKTAEKCHRAVRDGTGRCWVWTNHASCGLTLASGDRVLPRCRPSRPRAAPKHPQRRSREYSGRGAARVTGTCRLRREAPRSRALAPCVVRQ
jgi:hypothetical protein